MGAILSPEKDKLELIEQSTLGRSFAILTLIYERLYVPILSKIVKSPTLGIPHQIITNVSLCLFFNYSYYFNEMGSNKWCFFFHLILT